MNYYYADSQNSPVGPVSEAQLAELYSSGVITAETFVLAEGETDWLTYHSVATMDLVPLPAVPVAPAVLLSPMDSPPVIPRACPFCAEPIAAAALKCKHCGEILDPVLRAAQEAQHYQAAAVNMQQVTTVIAAGQKHSFPHLIHFMVSLLTMGLWLPVWILHYICRSRSYYD